MNKLWLVKCMGMRTAAYVVAKDSNAAYQKLRKVLEERDFGTRKSRELSSVELLADSTEFPDCDYRLIL